MSTDLRYRSRQLALAAGCAFLSGPMVGYAYDTVAAQAAANSEICEDAQPFYWEIGGATGSPIVSGQVGGTDYDRSTVVNLASSSKWIFSAYVLQRYNGLPTGWLGEMTVDALQMKRGHTNMTDLYCYLTSTVWDCGFIFNNEDQTWAHIDHFYYNSGHAQLAAASPLHLNLGDKTNSTLMSEINSYLDLGSSFAYLVPALSSGLEANAADYAEFLQKIMDGTYVVGDYLNYDPVQTYPCHEDAEGCTPFGTVDFHYSLNHWIEDNTGGTFPIHNTTLTAGDGAHSSPGAHGFYPWITDDKEYYGIISTQGWVGNYEYTIPCGRAIRAAFLDE